MMIMMNAGEGLLDKHFDVLAVFVVVNVYNLTCLAGCEGFGQLFTIQLLVGAVKVCGQ